VGYLIDTSTFYWAAAEPAQLSSKAVAALADIAKPRWLSVVSAYELANKHRLGKLPGFRPNEYNHAASHLGLAHLRLDQVEALEAGSHASMHRDPWDRIIAAQARAHALVVVSPDPAFDGLGCERLW
jgi:PIN domain nuclease of toxin-antitoxin system